MSLLDPSHIEVFETCRFCRREDLTVENEVKNFTGIIEKIAGIQIDLTPCLPNFICNNCVERLLDAVMIQEMCLESEVSLLEKYFGVSSTETMEIETKVDDIKNIKLEPGEVDEENDIKNEEEEDVYGSSEEWKVEEYESDNVDYLSGSDAPSELETEQKENEMKTTILPEADESQFTDEDPIDQNDPKPNSNSQVTCLHKRKYGPRSPLRDGETKEERTRRKNRERQSKVRKQVTDDMKQERKIKECCQCSFKHIVWPVVKQHFYKEHQESRLPKLPDSPIFCHLCWTPFSTRKEQLNHAKQPFIKKLICDICQTIFPDNMSLRKHLLSEHGITNKSFQCDECSSSYATSHALKDHKNLEHKGLRHVCDECGQTFKRASNLKEHKNLHLNINPYKCPFCEMRFPRKTAIRSHIKIHTGEKPYTCEYCDKRFSFKTDKKRHLPVHTGIFPFTCETCGKGFIRKNNYNQHLLTHYKDE